MARLRDVPQVIRTLTLKGFARKLWQEMDEDAVFTWASALAYSWVFALFPLVIAILTLAPYLPGATKENAETQIRDAVVQSMGPQAGDTIGKSISEVINQTQGGLLSFGLILAIWSASGGMTITMTALDKCYEVKNERSFLMHRLVAIGLTLGTVVLVLAVIILLPIGGAILGHFKDRTVLGPVSVILLDVLRYAVALGLLFAIVSLVYYFGPNIKQRWQTVSPGAFLAVAIILAMGFGFGIYVQNFGNFNKTYGALGAGIVLLLFCYLSAVALLVGAELNSVIDFVVLGVRPGTRDFTQPTRADAIQPATDAETKKIHSADAFEAKTVPDVQAVAPGWWKWAAASLAGGWAIQKLGSKAGQ